MKKPMKKVAKAFTGGKVSGTSSGSKSSSASPKSSGGMKSTGTVTSNARTGVATVSKSGTNPGYSGFSAKGLTSKDPANVARNRAAAAGYAAQAAARDNSQRNTNVNNTAKKAPPKAAPAAAPAAAPRHPIVEKWMGANRPNFTSASIPFVRRRRTPGETT